MVTLLVNGGSLTLSVDQDTPLLYVLRNDLELRGIAYVPRGETRLATIADVEVNQATRAGPRHPLGDCPRLRVHHQPGRPAGTIEANLIQSTSWALKEEVQFNQSGVTSVDWASYPILMAPEVPDKVEIILINRPDLPPSGAGEPASLATAPAIANAVFDATGARLLPCHSPPPALERGFCIGPSRRAAR
jgi:CO/xanthine dehydrogenase Mo-binding subunit